MKKLIDLTHPLSSETPTWDGSCGFNLTVDLDYEDCSGADLFRTQKISTRAGIGTHIDAPAHCFPGAVTIDNLKLEELVVNCAVIKVDEVADESYLVLPDIIERFERKHGLIRPQTFVIFYTGWSSLWSSPIKYRNSLRFPSVHDDTAKLLLERGIVGIGIDTLSPDARGESFPVHRAILGAGKYLVENVANAKELPPTGAQIFVMPMKITGGTEAPIRLVALT